MKRHIIIVAKSGDSETKSAKKIQSLLNAKDIETAIFSLDDIHATAFSKNENFDSNSNKILKNNTELVIVIGGDGSILYASQLVYKTNIPILGINFGHFGFLAETEKNNIHELVDKIVAKNYEIKKKQTIKCTLRNNKENKSFGWALNDIAINSTIPGKMINLYIATNNEVVVSFPSDGAVVSTATGSTAYSFSAGGPVVWPDVNCILLTPVAAHTLFSRPLLIGEKSTFNVLVKNHRKNENYKGAIARLSCDGNRNIELHEGAYIDFSLVDEYINFACLSEQSFASKIVEKFSLPVEGWESENN